MAGEKRYDDAAIRRRRGDARMTGLRAETPAHRELPLKGRLG